MVSKLPKLRLKKPYQQLTLPLYDQERKPEHWATVIGDFYEEATAQLAKGRRFFTDSSCGYCPDVVVDPNRTFIESKAAGRSNRIILYRNRLQFEREWAAENDVGINYYIWRHKFYSKLYNGEEINRFLARNTYEVVIVPMEVLHAAAEETPAERINKGGREGYVYGWRMPVKNLYRSPGILEEVRNLTVHRQRIKSLLVRRIPAPEQSSQPVKVSKSDPF